MDDGMLLILTGPPGAGKTTVGALIAAETPLSACIHSDWFWTTIVNGPVLDHGNPQVTIAEQDLGVVRTICAVTRSAMHAPMSPMLAILAGAP